MKIGDITKKLRYCSSGTITFHIYDKGSGCSEDLFMTPKEIFDLQSQGEKTYPLGATLESIDYIQGKLIVNGSLRKYRCKPDPPKGGALMGKGYHTGQQSGRPSITT